MTVATRPGPIRLSDAPAPPPARPRLLLVGTTFAAVASVMVFGGMIGIYLALRADTLAGGDAWLPQGISMPLTPATTALVIMGMSSVAIQWAVYAVGNDDRPSTYLALGLTILMGVAYMVEIAYYYTQIGVGVTDPSGFGVLLYGITGAHLAMVGGAMAFAGLMAFRTLGGQYSGRDREGVSAAALYWHTTVAMYAVIWYAIFVMK
jgi:heme/copper-type cytochrome/quinol oxidase subunit 3